MNQIRLKTILLFTGITFLISGCNSIPFIDNTPDYKGAGRSRPLEVPPDLTSISSNDTYTVPGSTTYSSYSQGQDDQVLQKEKVLPNPDNVHLERAGSQRWLVVQAPPEKIWPVIREFWSELGFAVRVENSETGVMETEWVDPSSLTKDDKGNYLDKFQGWLDKLNTLENRQKFRTRIDQGVEKGTTEIYMSHRSISENGSDDYMDKVVTSAGVVENGYKFNKNASRTKQDEDRSNSEDIDAELLRRLMVRLGVEEQKSRSIIASGSTELRANLAKNPDGSPNLSVFDDFDRAWRRVGLALDRIGFVVEDKNRSSGLYYVQYTDVDTDDGPAKKKGIFDHLKFWGDDTDEKKAEPKPEPKEEDTGIIDKLQFWKTPPKKLPEDNSKQYRVKVQQSGDKVTRISVVDKQDNVDKSTTATRIINLLYEQLR